MKQYGDRRSPIQRGNDCSDFVRYAAKHAHVALVIPVTLQTFNDRATMAMPSTAPDLNKWLVLGFVTDLRNDRDWGA